jgi:hypothetical protein
MNEGVQLCEPYIVANNRILECSLGLRVLWGATASVITNSALETITVDVHIGEGTTDTLEVDYTVVIEVIPTVRESCTELVLIIERRGGRLLLGPPFSASNPVCKMLLQDPAATMLL